MKKTSKSKKPKKSTKSTKIKKSVAKACTYQKKVVILQQILESKTHIITTKTNNQSNFNVWQNTNLLMSLPQIWLMKAIIGRNLKYLREANHFTAQHMADCLSINRSAYANYEAGLREMPLALLEKAADFLGVDLAALYEEDETKRPDVLEGAFRMDGLTAEDCREIAYFKSIVMNYMKMSSCL